jgi:phage tail protein X
MMTIKTIQGDTWDKISLRVFGSENFLNKLIESNPEHRKKFIFPSGVVLNVPEVDTESALINESLPPWKR